MRTREGLTLLGAAVVDDVLVLLVLSIFLALNGSDESIGLVVIKMLGYLMSVRPAGLVRAATHSDVDRSPAD